MEGRVLRRSVTLADQLAAVGPAASPTGSCNLRDLLKLRDEDDGRRAAAAVTLASAMQAERRASSPPSSSPSAAAAARTLLDIIRDDQPTPTPGSYGAPVGAAGDPFVRRAVSLPTPQTASPPAPTGAVPPPLPPPEASPPTDQEEEEEQGERVSLMALLEQTERQWSAVAAAPTELDAPAAAEPESEPSQQDSLGPEDDAEHTGPGAASGGCCCVCMARAKGAAFIPCGHTFCRGCARELLAGRGRCPLCNAAIVDVLDIF